MADVYYCMADTKKLNDSRHSGKTFAKTFGIQENRQKMKLFAKINKLLIKTSSI